MSTTVRRAWLHILKAAGIRRFVATSGIGHPFVCHIGDFLGEAPFYNRDVFRVELEVCAAWLRSEDRPVVFDVGANVGFWSTHLAQMVNNKALQIYAFEPVPATFAKLVDSVATLHLDRCVHPIPAAMLDASRPVVLNYSPHNSLFAQISSGELNPRTGDRLVYSVGCTLDEFSSVLGITPTFIKIDVEGSEFQVLRGARRLLTGPDRPCLMFEYNPVTLGESGTTGAALWDMLPGYSMYYVDDFEGQRYPVGKPIESSSELTWVCNVLAVPQTELSASRFAAVLGSLLPNLDERLHEPSPPTRSPRSGERAA